MNEIEQIVLLLLQLYARSQDDVGLAAAIEELGKNPSSEGKREIIKKIANILYPE